LFGGSCKPSELGETYFFVVFPVRVERFQPVKNVVFTLKKLYYLEYANGVRGYFFETLQDLVNEICDHGYTPEITWLDRDTNVLIDDPYIFPENAETVVECIILIMQVARNTTVRDRPAG
jgi:hypothetical protein